MPIALPRSVLVIQNDPIDAETLSRALRALDLKATWTGPGRIGLDLARCRPFDLVLIDRDVPDTFGTAVAEALRDAHPYLRFIVLTQGGARGGAPGATTAGMSWVLEKPFDTIDVVSTVNAALASAAASAVAGSIGERWARWVLRTIDAASDPRTIVQWARMLGVSRSTLCDCCRLVRVMPRAARDFARMMRTICRSGERWEPEALLDLADVRTFKRLIARSGLRLEMSRPPSVPDFLERQQWIPMGNPGLVVLRNLLQTGEATCPGAPREASMS